MYLELAIVVVIIILIMWVGVKEGPNYYLTNDIFPQLVDLDLKQITSEAQKIDQWPNHPENNYPTIILCELTKWTKKYPTLTKALKSTKFVTVRLVKPDNTNKHQGWADISNHTLRNCVLLDGKCEMQVAKQSQKLQLREWVTFDSSKPYSFKSNGCMLLMIDIERPEKIIPGKSKIPIPDDILEIL